MEIEGTAEIRVRWIRSRRRVGFVSLYTEWRAQLKFGARAEKTPRNRANRGEGTRALGEKRHSPVQIMHRVRRFSFCIGDPVHVCGSIWHSIFYKRLVFASKEFAEVPINSFKT
jgi:hypothetical protein